MGCLLDYETSANSEMEQLALPDRVSKLEKHIETIAKDLRGLKQSVEAISRPSTTPALTSETTVSARRTPTEWTRDHKIASGILIATILGLPLLWFTWWQPQHASHEEQDFNLKTDQRIDLKLKKPIEDIHQIQIDVAKINSKIDELNALLPSIVQSRWREGWKITPQNLKQTVPEINSVAVASKQLGVSSVPVQQVSQVGNALLPIAQDSPEAWNALLSVISYRSTLNSGLVQIGPSGPLPKNVVWHYGGAKLPPGGSLPQLSFSSDFGVPAAQAARLSPIGTDPNASIPVGPAYLVMTGNTFSIDGLEIRDVFFKDVEIHYSGAELKMQRAVFINCTFVFDNLKPARELAKEILASPRVRFSAS
jgi:hypothetical protein